MALLSNPFLWSLLCMAGILASTAIASSGDTADQPRLRALAGALFCLGAVGTAAPWTTQPRFGLASLWNEIAGALIALGAAWLMVANLLALTRVPRFAGLWLQETFDVLRNPVYLGEALLAAGLALAMGSYVGLALAPLWLLAFIVPASLREYRLSRNLGYTYLQYLFQVPSRYLPRWLMRRRPAPRFPYRNLAFKGGGVRGIAYAGALETLDSEGILDQIERVSGTSVGAITALLVSLRLEVPEMVEAINSVDLEQVPQARPRQINSGLGRQLFPRLSDDAACWDRLVSNYGWYSSAYVYDWLHETIARYCGGNERATFRQFRELGMRDLYVVAGNISQRRSEVFSHETTPDVAVADAVRLSMSIPVYFEALRFDGVAWGQGDYYVDGGVYDNYPIQVFDEPRFAEGNRWYKEGINWETLGCYLYSEAADEPSEPKNLREYLKLTVVNLVASTSALAYERNPIDQLRTIKIGDRGIGAVEFDLRPGGERYQALISSGREAAQDFVDRFRL